MAERDKMICGSLTPGTGGNASGYTYVPNYHKECYRNKCDACDCRTCGDKRLCETRINKCSYCPFDQQYWGYPQYQYTFTGGCR